MEYADILLTTAEIGVTIAGFSTLATMFMVQPGSAVRLDVYRFEGMLINSLLVIAFSLLPLLVNALGLEILDNWRLSSLVLLLVYGSRGTIITVNTLRFKKSGHPVGRPFIVMTVLLVVVSLVLLANVIWPTATIAGGMYLVGLFGVLTNACVLFLLVFLSGLTKTKEEKN